MVILELAEQYINENGLAMHISVGNGKIPIVPPHTNFYYGVSRFFVIFTYVVGSMSITEALLAGLLVHKSRARDQSSMDLNNNVDIQ